MLRVEHFIGNIKDVAQRKSVLIQLVLQIYLLVSSTIMLPMAAQILSQQVQCFDEDSPSEMKPIDKQPSQTILKAGTSLLIYSILQILVSVFCIVLLSRIYRVFTKQPIYVGIEAFASVFLLIMCVYAFIHIVLLIRFLTGAGAALLCMEDVVKSGTRTWLEAMLPVHVMSIVSLVAICFLIVSTKVTSSKQSPVPRVRLMSVGSCSSGPKMQSFTISQPMEFLQNPIDSFQRLRRPRLPSLRSLHVSLPNSPILFEIPLTPQQTNTSANQTWSANYTIKNQNKSDLIQNESDDILSPLNDPELIQSSITSEPNASRSFEYPNVWMDDIVSPIKDFNHLQSLRARESPNVWMDDIVSPINDLNPLHSSRASEPHATRSFESPNVWVDETGSSGSNNSQFNWSWIVITTPTPEPANSKC